LRRRKSLFQWCHSRARVVDIGAVIRKWPMCISGDTPPRSLIKIDIQKAFGRVLTGARKGFSFDSGCTLGPLSGLHCNHPVTVVPIAALNSERFRIKNDLFHGGFF
jgi:hypothetical protein